MRVKELRVFTYLQSLSAVNTLGARLETNFEILLTFPQENHLARGCLLGH